jgi:hypothetical protein
MFPAQIGIVDLDPAGQLATRFTLRHGVQQLVFDPPRRAIAHAEMAHQFQRRDVVLGLGQQMHGQKPDRQRQLRGREDRAGRRRGLMAAAPTLSVGALGALERGGQMTAAHGAHETLRP